MAKKYVIIGLGEFGVNLAVDLVGRGFDVLAIDKDENRVNNIKDIIPNSIIADVTKKNILESLELNLQDSIIVSLGNTMEPSILCVLNLKSLGFENIIVKAHNEDHYKILEKLGANKIVYPEKDMALRIAQTLSNKNVSDFLPLVPGFSIQKIDSTEVFTGKTLKEIDLRNKFNAQIIAVSGQNEDEINLVPRSDYRIKKNDQIFILGKDDDITKITSQRIKKSRSSKKK